MRHPDPEAKPKGKDLVFWILRRPAVGGTPQNDEMIHNGRILLWIIQSLN